MGFILKVPNGQFIVSQSHLFCMFENFTTLLQQCQVSSAARKQADKQESKSVLFSVTHPVWPISLDYLTHFKEAGLRIHKLCWYLIPEYLIHIDGNISP